MTYNTLTLRSTGGRFQQVTSRIGVGLPSLGGELSPRTGSTYWTTCLWDTGASHTAISQQVAEVLGLLPDGEARLLAFHGEYYTNTYRVSLNLPDLVHLKRWKVTECVSNDDFGVIIGMDIICQGDLAITNAGDSTTFSVCFPSLEEIDYSIRTFGR